MTREIEPIKPIPVVDIAQLRDMTDKAVILVDEACQLTVTDQDSANSAGVMLARLDAEWKELEDTRKELVAPVNEYKSKIQAVFTPTLDLLKGAMKRCKQNVANWRRAEAEKARLLAEAAAAEEQRRQRERLKEQAKKAKQAGRKEKAEALNEIHDATPTRVVTTPTEVAGMSFRTVYSGRVTDLKKLVGAIAAGTAPITLVKVDQSALNRIAGALRESMDFPGVELVADEEAVKKRSA